MTFRFSEGLDQHVVAPVMQAIVAGHAAYPPSPVIKSIHWAPKESIVRMAQDSDNWPLTWADDDSLYTAYGDGYGFEPKVPDKLSLGFAKVDGGPTDFRGINIRSPSGEQKGSGRKGKKASGMLMVGGILYLWVRNAGNSQLALSSDHGKTWKWCDWKFTTSFGCPTFLNFGKNYAGAGMGTSMSIRPTATAPMTRPTAWCWPGCRKSRSPSGKPTNSSRAWTRAAVRFGPRISASGKRSSPIRGSAAGRRSLTIPG